MVGVQGFEPWTPCSQSRCATRLRYTPTEPLFYTERPITGKSCKIRHMPAYFSSKFKKQIRVALTAAMLLLCLQGTQWVGLSHSVAHAKSQTQEQARSTQAECQQSINHSADVCHLFDAVSLAGFIPSPLIGGITFHNPASEFSNKSYLFISFTALELYQSRAPPILLL